MGPPKKFVERDTLTLGICNGCQIVANLGLAPAIDKQYGERFVAVTHNLTARYQCRWVDVDLGHILPMAVGDYIHAYPGRAWRRPFHDGWRHPEKNDKQAGSLTRFL